MAKKVQVPEVRAPGSHVAAAAQQAIDRIKANALPDITEADLHWNDPETDIVRGNPYTSDCWIHGPANIQLLTSAHKQLLKTAGNGVNKVQKVRIARVGESKFIMIKATFDTDASGIEVKYYDSSAWINAVSVLGPSKLKVRTGYRDRFVVQVAPDGYPGAPALLIDLGDRLERVYKGTEKAHEITAPAPKSAQAMTAKTAKAVELTAEEAQAVADDAVYPKRGLPEFNIEDLQFYTAKQKSKDRPST